MNSYWSDFWPGASVAAVAGVIAGFTQASLNTPVPDAIVGGIIVFVLVAFLSPFVRRWAATRRAAK